MIIRSIILSILLSSCFGRQVYKNNENSCKLILLRDSSYSYSVKDQSKSCIPERGTYTINKNSIKLQHYTISQKESVANVTEQYQKEQPDSINLSFKNINNKATVVKFSINNNPQLFETNEYGKVSLSYVDLATFKIDSLKIYYQDLKYEVKQTFIKPTTLIISLNQYANQNYAINEREYEIYNDTIIANDLNEKLYKENVKLIKK
jgi:hypothetical protein